MAEPTEDATPKKLADARRKGQVASSRDAVATASLLAALGATWAMRDHVRTAFDAAIRTAVYAAAQPGRPRVDGALVAAATEALSCVAVPVAAGALTAALIGALLTGFVFAPEAAMPKLERLDPFQALTRFTKPRTYVEPLLQLLKGATMIALGWTAARAVLPEVLAAPRLGAQGMTSLLGDVLRRGVTRMAALAVALAGVDALYRRIQLARDLKMSRDEVRREHKDSDGDPHAKQEREKLHRELLREATLDRVKKASFVVTNPTHYAVALAWDDETMDAPELVAKGEGEFARRIIAEARRAGVTVLRDAPLARSLHELEVGDAIPEALYEAVAAVVGYLADGSDPDAWDGG